jgi:hypothetical protein
MLECVENILNVAPAIHKNSREEFDEAMDYALYKLGEAVEEVEWSDNDERKATFNRVLGEMKKWREKLSAEQKKALNGLKAFSFGSTRRKRPTAAQTTLRSARAAHFV